VEKLPKPGDGPIMQQIASLGQRWPVNRNNPKHSQ